MNTEPTVEAGVTVTLDTPVRIGGLRLRNRLYRAPLLEHAGNESDACDRLIDALEPCAAAGVGLVMQGATPVRGQEGCAAPGMTWFDDPDRVASMRPLTEAIADHGGRIFAQLAHGGLRSVEVWHRGYRRGNPEIRQRAVSEPPLSLQVADRLGFIEFDVDVLTTDDVYDLAADFGRTAGWAAAAGYDGIYLAGATMGIFQQFLSPFYNDRNDEFGGSPAARTYFFELVFDEIRERTDVPVVTKVPAETDAAPFVRKHITESGAVDACERLADVGYDALVPVRGSTFWDQSLIKGEFPDRAWADERFEGGFHEAFGGGFRRRLVEIAARLSARSNPFEPAWNADLCRRVRERVDVPVLCVGGVRDRPTMDALVGDACEMVGMARPFYAEPRLAARLLADVNADVICKSCNNCVPPQATGAVGVCRTPAVLRERGRLERDGAYDVEGDGE